ncbi:MAG: hypothetical protein QNJ47_06010 [Nostocaceae cyanobacterium]|nr:hypothetical protein [Nostocaceae cyanobacterium]
MLSDIDLVRNFVKNSIQKKEALLSNSIFIAEKVYNNNQLRAKKEGIILNIKLNQIPTQFLIKSDSEHWDLMNNVLGEYNFILTGEIDSFGFYPYQHCQPPEGYQMNCTKSVVLWRAWWKYKKYAIRRTIPLELLIRTRNSWYPIRDLILSNGFMYIKTLGSEITLSENDLVTWLNKIDVNQTKQNPLKIKN